MSSMLDDHIFLCNVIGVEKKFVCYCFVFVYHYPLLKRFHLGYVYVGFGIVTALSMSTMLWKVSLLHMYTKNHLFFYHKEQFKTSIRRTDGKIRLMCHPTCRKRWCEEAQSMSREAGTRTYQRALVGLSITLVYRLQVSEDINL